MFTKDANGDEDIVIGTFEYDAAGNLVNQTVNGVTHKIVYGTDNRPQLVQKVTGAVAGAAFGAGASYITQITTNVAKDGFSSQAFTDVDLKEIGKEAVVGAAGDAFGGIGALGGSSVAGRVAAGVAEEVVSTVASTVVGNALEPGTPLLEGLNDPVGMAAGALGVGAGMRGAGRNVDIPSGSRPSAGVSP